jgi:hypothetical protein
MEERCIGEQHADELLRKCESPRFSVACVAAVILAVAFPASAQDDVTTQERGERVRRRIYYRPSFQPAQLPERSGISDLRIRGPL